MKKTDLNTDDLTFFMCAVMYMFYGSKKSLKCWNELRKILKIVLNNVIIITKDDNFSIYDKISMVREI